MTIHRRLSLAALTASVLAAIIGARAQSSPQQPTFRAGVNFVRVDAYPMANGRPVADLRKEDFEVLEDSVPQTVETFEHVVIRGGGPDPLQEPASIRASDDAAANPRSRVFVLFLDSYHISSLWSAGGAPVDVTPTRLALRAFLQRLIGPDDLVALMRPETPVDGLTFTRRPASFDEFLRTALWQRMGDDLDLEPRERLWDVCYPPEGAARHSAIVVEMMARSREQRVLDALRRLVLRLQTLREERKAILIVSQGWALYRPNPALASLRPGESMPGPPPIGVGRGGGLTIGRDDRELVPKRQCDADRLELAGLDNARDFRTLTETANRANATFYPINPAGLLAPVSASAFDPREETLRDLAASTDGIAAVGSNDPAPVLTRIAQDTSSYYLLGYYSTNAKLDGKFRKISVRVKRPGVSVRARPGYLAPTDAEVKERARDAALPDPEVATRNAALGSLDAVRPDRPLRLRAGLGPDGLWIVLELDFAAARELDWAQGQATVTVVSPAGDTIATDRATVSPAARAFVVRVPGVGLKQGAYLVRVRLQGRQGSLADASEQVRVIVPDPTAEVSGLGAPLLFRRGPYTGVAYQPTADVRFRKAERVRVDVPLAAAPETVTARLLDRKGQPLNVPVTVGAREEGGLRFATAEVTLAPLAPSDYLIEISARTGTREEKVIAAIRIVP
jgi:VWFA-related protein